MPKRVLSWLHYFCCPHLVCLSSILSPIVRARAGLAPGLALLIVGCELERNPQPIVSVDELPLIRLEERFRIGDVADPERGLSRIDTRFDARSVDVDDAGSVYIFEGMDLQIRVFDSAGGQLRRIGRAGPGPGEFTRANRIGVVGDTVWALETNCVVCRITLFTRQGDYLFSSQVDAAHVTMAGRYRGAINPHILDTTGLFLGYVATFALVDGPSSGLEPGDTIHIPIVRYDLAGRIVDTVGWYPRIAVAGAAALPPAQRRTVQVGSNQYRVPLPPPDGPLSILTGAGRLVLNSDVGRSGRIGTLDVAMLTFGGDTIGRQRYSYEPREYPSDFLDSLAVVESRYRAFATAAGGVAITPVPPGSGSDSVEVRRRIRASMDFPQFQPPVSAYWVAHDGSVWLRREDTGGSSDWVVVDSNGTASFRISLPRSVYPVRHARATLFAIATDAFGVPTLIKYSVQDFGS